ncbi:MAG: hypothetical protein V1494_00175 [Candidatus Diapherotrites archaeon]
MELFKIANGPWRQIFQGSFQGHELEVYANPDNILLSMVLDIEKKQIVGTIFQLYKVFSATGEIEGFVESLPREVLVLERHEKNETLKFLMLGSNAAYVKFKENEFINEVEAAFKRVEMSSTMIKDISKAYGLTLDELKDASEKAKGSFFAQPLLIPMLGASTGGGIQPGETQESSPGTFAPVAKGEVMLGLTKEKKPVLEPFNFFQRTIIAGGENAQRKHALHVLIEGALLSNIAVTLIDFGNEFHGLSEGSKETGELKKYGIDMDPIGFPVKQFRPGKEVFVDFEATDGKGLLDLFGAGESAAADAIDLAIRKEKPKDAKDLSQKIKLMPLTDEFTDYQKNKAVRIVTLITLSYPELFKAKNTFDEISKSWVKSIGRAGIINLKDTDARQALLIVNNVVNGVIERFKATERTMSTKALIVIPDAEKIIGRAGKEILAVQTAKALAEGPLYGVAFAVSAERELDLAEELSKTADARIELISGNDAGVQLKNKKAYRVFLRPALSKCTEKN